MLATFLAQDPYSHTPKAGFFRRQLTRNFFLMSSITRTKEGSVGPDIITQAWACLVVHSMAMRFLGQFDSRGDTIFHFIDKLDR